MVAVRNPEIRKAVDTLYELSSDEQVRLDYERRLKALRDRNSQIEGYYQDGIAVGEQRGEQKTQNYVLQLISQGLSTDEIKQRLENTKNGSGKKPSLSNNKYQITNNK